MRYHYLRFDIWLCLLISMLLTFIPVKILEATLPKSYESYEEEHKVEDGEIGGIADENVYRAQSVEDLLSHDTFTVVSPGIQYRNKGGLGHCRSHETTTPAPHTTNRCEYKHAYICVPVL